VSEKYTFIEAENATVAGETACAQPARLTARLLELLKPGA
jgi:hypothetical protein